MFHHIKKCVSSLLLSAHFDHLWYHSSKLFPPQLLILPTWFTKKPFPFPSTPSQSQYFITRSFLRVVSHMRASQTIAFWCAKITAEAVRESEKAVKAAAEANKSGHQRKRKRKRQRKRKGEKEKEKEKVFLFY